MNTKIQTVTPEVAARYLASNHDGTFKNRPLSKLKVQQFAKDILGGNWQVTHQGIGLYYDKAKKCYVLVDGQHRLTAIVKTNVAVEMLVTSYDTREQALKAIAAVDVGTARSAAHIGAMVGICSDRAEARSAAARYFALIETGNEPTKAEVLDRIQSTTSLFEAVYSSRWKSQTITAAFMFSGFVFGVDAVAEIARRVSIGEGLTASEVMVQKVILDSRGGSKTQALKNTLKLIRAIEACLDGEVLRYIPERPREAYVAKLLSSVK